MPKTPKKINRKFVNPNNVSRYLYCCICEEIFYKPIRIKECGHTFCKACLQKWAKVNKNCPLCRQKFNIKSVKRDNIAYNIINDLEVFCNNNNCPWKGNLLNLKKHLKNCNLNPSKMNDKIKEIIDDKNKRKSLDLSSSTINTLNEINEEKNNSDNEDNEGRTSVDNITSFNTRVNLRARLFNRNKNLVNKVLNNEINKGYSKNSIFSLIEENNIKI